jgi:hypothetical protein
MGAESLDEVGPRRRPMPSSVVKDGGEEGEVEGGKGCFRHARRVAWTKEEVKKRNRQGSEEVSATVYGKTRDGVS